MSFLYDVAFAAYALFAAPAFIAKGKHRDHFGERAGRPEEAVREFAGKGEVLWIHAVSAGEMRLAIRFARDFLSAAPGWKALLTSTTATGRSLAVSAGSERIAAAYFPLDLGLFVRRFLDGVRPRGLVLFETEIWPNLIHEMRRRGLPVIVANARLSDRAWPRYRAASFWLKSSFGRISKVLAQSEEHAARFLAIGAPAGRVLVTGNMKYDLAEAGPSEPVRRVLGPVRPRPMFVAASTHRTEEEKVLAAYGQIRRRAPGTVLVLAPRHPERFAEAEDLLSKSGLDWTSFEKAVREPAGPWEALLLDRFGILNECYSFADAVFVGGSFVPVGGHNLAEPALLAKPVFYGPRTENFRDMRLDFERSGFDGQVADERDLARRVAGVLNDRSLAGSVGLKLRAAVLRNRGACENNVREVLRCFS